MILTSIVWDCVEKTETSRGVTVCFEASPLPRYDRSAPRYYRAWVDEEYEMSHDEDKPPFPHKGSLRLLLKPRDAERFSVGKYYNLDLTQYELPKPKLEPDDFTIDELNRLFGGVEVHWDRETLRRMLIFTHCIPG